MRQDMEIFVENVEQLKLLFKKKIAGFHSKRSLQEISNLETHPILRPYIMFKEKSYLENYISIISSKISTCYYSILGQFP